MNQDYFGLSASGIAQGILAGNWTSLEVVQGYIERVKRVNPSLNAMVQDRFSIAIEEAKAVDVQTH